MPSFLSRIFGKSASAPAKAAAPAIVAHGDYRILPQPIREAAGYRIAARVERDVNGETRVHQLIRADTRQTLDEAVEASVAKAKQAIDQLGDGLFG